MTGSINVRSEPGRVILDYRHRDTTLGGYLNAELVSQDDFLSVGDGVIGRDRLDVIATANSIIKRMHWASQTVAPVNGQVPVIFTAKAAGLVWDTLATALNGKRVMEGTSPWGNRWHEQVISNAITLRQDPFVGPYSCPFDDEGILAQAITFIESGVVENWYTHSRIGAGDAECEWFDWQWHSAWTGWLPYTRTN